MTRAVTRYLTRSLALALVWAGQPAHAGQVLVDQGLRVAGLWCFPVATQPDEYRYLPTAAGLSRDGEGRPRFSFVRYALDEAAAAEDSSITKADGGGVLHFLVEYATPEAQVLEAQRALRRTTGRNEARLAGPVAFDQGRYTLVSSILSDGGEREHRALASGPAPVLENGQIALAFELDAREATLLLASLTMPTPDVSLVFDLTFHGVADAYDAELVIDWAEVRKHKAFGAGGSYYFVGADIDLLFDDLLRDNAIRLVSAGANDRMQALVDRVYDRLLTLLFAPVPAEQAADGGNLGDALGMLFDPKDGPLSGRKTAGTGGGIAFELKETRSSGTSRLRFDHAEAVERHHFLTFNIGGLYHEHGGDEAHFRVANLVDPLFQRREIGVALDGALLPEFERFVNNVTVTLRKRHESGRETVRDLVLHAGVVEEAAGDLRMVYGWDEDDERLDWLVYDYRTQWNFKGGGQVTTPWVSQSDALITLYAPYRRRLVKIVGTAEELLDRDVRAVTVRVEYPFFGETRSEQLLLRPRPDELIDQDLELTLPQGEYDYDYSLTWTLEGGRRLQASGRDDTGVLFVDTLPAPDTATSPDSQRE